MNICNELNKIINQLEENGLIKEASNLHKVFVKIAQDTPPIDWQKNNNTRGFEQGFDPNKSFQQWLQLANKDKQNAKMGEVTNQASNFYMSLRSKYENDPNWQKFKTSVYQKINEMKLFADEKRLTTESGQQLKINEVKYRKLINEFKSQYLAAFQNSTEDAVYNSWKNQAQSVANGKSVQGWYLITPDQAKAFLNQMNRIVQQNLKSFSNPKTKTPIITK